MKRISALFFILALLAAATACSPRSPAPADVLLQGTSGPSIVSGATPAPQTDAAPAPDPEPYTPQDIFGGAFNPFHDADFPDHFNVHGASFDVGVEKLGGKPHYVLSVTAEGKTDESILFLAKLAGIEDAQTAAQYAQDFKKGGFCEFEGAGNAVFTIRATDRSDDRYEYVEGVYADISIRLTDAQAARYLSLVRDNFNVDALAAAADYFDVTPVFDECSIAVNLHKNEVSVDMRYTVANAATVQKNMAENVLHDWYDAQNAKMGFTYGMLRIELRLEGKGCNLYVNERTSDIKSVLSAYAEPKVSLAKLGFGFDREGVCGVYEQYEPHYMAVAIHRPEWDEFAEGWNIEYYDEVNGYVLRMTYHASEDRYHISADKDHAGAAFDYLPAAGEYGWEHPDPDAVKRIFNDAFGTQGEDVYEKPLAHFEQLVRERFGLSVGELYALPIR